MNKSLNKTIGFALESVLFQENFKHINQSLTTTVCLFVLPPVVSVSARSRKHFALTWSIFDTETI